MAGAKLVVSESGDNLSPKYAPEITAAATKGAGKPMPTPVAINARPMVAIEVKEVPVEIDTTAVTKAAVGTKKVGLIIL
jgi:hypothetical protein